MREVFYDPSSGGLLVLPMAELNLLRNSSLFEAAVVSLKPGALFPPPLPAGAGATVDLEATFVVPAAGQGPSSFGVSVLAEPTTTFHSVCGLRL